LDEFKARLQEMTDEQLIRMGKRPDICPTQRMGLLMPSMLSS
jgi:hypothetical protein